MTWDDIFGAAGVCIVVTGLLYGSVEVDAWLTGQHETRCKDDVARGLIEYRCRHWWDLCPLYYDDCRFHEIKYVHVPLYVDGKVAGYRAHPAPGYEVYDD